MTHITTLARTHLWPGIPPALDPFDDEPPVEMPGTEPIYRYRALAQFNLDRAQHHAMRAERLFARCKARDRRGRTLIVLWGALALQQLIDSLYGWLT